MGEQDPAVNRGPLKNGPLISNPTLGEETRKNLVHQRIQSLSRHTRGPQTAYSQQHIMLLDANVQDPRQKRQVVVDLKKFITDITKKHEHVILALDANKVLEPAGVPVKPTSINALQRDCGLQDVYEYQHESRGALPAKNNTK